MGRLYGHEWEVEEHWLGLVMSHDHFSGLLKQSDVTSSLSMSGLRILTFENMLGENLLLYSLVTLSFLLKS